jgi:hypothetical protein
MVQPEVYGTWEEKDGEFQKETDSKKFVLEPLLSEEKVYCFLEFENETIEFNIVTIHPDEICSQIMKLESHGKGIVDVIKEFNNSKL